MTPAHATPPQGARIEVRDLTKRFGDFTAVDSLSFTVEPGRITGFLGPNGAGKTTTLRMLLGLVRPTHGTATIGGHRYHDIPQPMAMVGSALEATNFHPGRSGRDHLRVLADTAGRRRPAGRRDARARRDPRGRPQACRRLLDGHAPAPRPGRRHARRPAGAHPRRAGQRPRPRGHPLAARLPAPRRRPGQDRPRLEPHAPGGRADGRRRRDHLQRPARQAGADGRPARRRPQPGAHLRPRRPRRGAARRRRHERGGRGRRAARRHRRPAPHRRRRPARRAPGLRAAPRRHRPRGAVLLADRGPEPQSRGGARRAGCRHRHGRGNS